MTTLLLVRHGQTDWNRDGRFQGVQDIPLNDEGREQMRRLAAAWTDPADLLVSSPLGRARESAELLRPALGGLPLLTDGRLIERDYGLGSGLTLSERQERFPDGVIPGVEAPEAVRARAAVFLAAVEAKHEGRTVVAVSHGGLINALLWLVSGGRWGTGRTLLANAGVTALTHSAGAWSVRSVGAAARP